MKRLKLLIIALAIVSGGLWLSNCQSGAGVSQALTLNDSLYFEKHGFNILVFSNMYDNLFDDSKISAVEIIHHGIRTATNGDVRLNPTPGQWDPIAKFVDRKVDRENRRITVTMNFTAYDFQYALVAEAQGDGLHLSVNVDKPLPEALKGIAGLNLEFFPPVFWGTSYIIDNKYGLFPTSPADFMTFINGQVEPTPIATGKKIEIAPDDPLKHLTVRLVEGDELLLLDGRNKQQNGTFVLRTLLPAGKTGKIAEWFITGESVSDWIRPPVVSYSQVGYHPAQEKLAVIELDQNDKPLSAVSLWKINDDGSRAKALSGKPEAWGRYLRYNYLQFDFSQVKEPGIYELEYGTQRTAPFPIAADVFARAWFPTLDVFMPVQMDHMFVREAYRVWHGAAHLDDALQAPLNRVHWDGWRQGSSTGNKYEPLQHIPGLNVGGWFDAGDFDIQTPSQQSTVQSLVKVYETFGIDRDETTVSQQTRYVDIHVPDGKLDILQQIEHGALQLAAQVRAIGYAIAGINESHLYQYRHLGDAVTKTDNLVYNPRLDSLQTDGRTSGTPDDRWAFTNRSAYLNYNTTISLAAAARVLKDYNPAFAAECLDVAQYIWKDEHSRPAESEANQPFFVRGFGVQTELLAALELWRTTGTAAYKARVDEILPELEADIER
ncbi:MAG: glycoside hydrolase family 9 protein, partial [Tannerella sp.]|nr:glycoside hydrolase family 9 protein [Tannerella sp.]